jgi:hypothetical protein
MISDIQKKALKKIFESSSSPGQLFENWFIEYKNITGKKFGTIKHLKI